MTRPSLTERYLSPRSSREGPASFALGCMNFGKRTPKAEAVRVIHTALDAGVGLFDTANAYNDGVSEQILGEALRGRGDQALIASKVGFGQINGKPEGLSRANVIAACEASLGRLGVDAIDLYYLHVPDYSTPIEESLGAIQTLLEAGKIRHWGVSNYASWQILEMKGLLGMPAVAQQVYNVLVRQLDIEYFKFTARYPIHTTVYNPLAGGILVGAHAPEQRPPKGSRFDNNSRYRRRYWNRALFAATEDLRSIAADQGVTLLQLAYAFVLRHPGVDSVLVGPGSVSHLEDALVARELALSPDSRARIDAVYRDLVGTDASYAR